MTAYATPSNMMTWFGAKELAEITGLDDLTPVPPTLMRLTIDEGDRDSFTDDEISAADAALVRLQTAIDDASHLMNAYLGRRYTLPLEESVVQSSSLPRICGDLARLLLQDDFAPSDPNARHLRALVWLQDLAEGRAELGDASEILEARTDLPVYSFSVRYFSSDKLKGFL